MTEKTEDRISEAASEKRKRGRPPIMGEDIARHIDLTAGGNVQTHRHKLNIYYQIRALSLLGEDSHFSWLVDLPKAKAGAKNAWKPGILSELGRIWDDEGLKIVALRICELKPKTKDAITMIRRVRLAAIREGKE